MAIAASSDFQDLRIEKVAVSGKGGMTEGPASLSDGSILFSDLRLGKVFHLALDGSLREYLSSERRINGLMIDSAERIFACEGLVGEAALVRFDYPSTDRIPLTESFNGKAYNAANDLAIDRDGGVYFSDLRKGANLPQEKAGVYYLAANGNVNRVIDDLDTPNGVILSRDERFLLVAATRELRIVRYPILQPGRLGTGETFYRFDSIEGTRLGGDGMTIDVNGNFYFAHFRGRKVDVVSPDGERLAEIPFPDNTTNCVFGGPDGRTLFVTSGNAVYAVRMKIPGHRFPGRRQ